MVESGPTTETNNNNENNNNNNTTKEENYGAGSLPVNCLPLTHQVAGHFYGKGRTKLGKAANGSSCTFEHCFCCYSTE